jgi:AAA15 family ATPase/GTPase
MLLRFSATNYLSIFEKQELSLIATSLRDGDGGLIGSNLVPSGHVLPSAIIYGANASGKSNVLKALRFMRDMVRLSHLEGRPDSGVPRMPFKLAHDASLRPSLCDIDFVVDDIRYHFGFEATNKEFAGEWLYAFPSGRRQMLYDRTGKNEINFGRSLKGRNRVIADLMRDNSLFLSAAIQNNHEELTKISKFFDAILFSTNIEIEGFDISHRFKDGQVDQRTIEFLRKMGTGIVDFQCVKLERTEKERLATKDLLAFLNKLNPDATITHNIDHDGKLTLIELAHTADSGDKIFFKPDDESAGTRRLIVLVSSVYEALDQGSLIVVDELDASLHTQVCEAVVKLFSNPKTNPNGAQLIATTHDTNLMRSPILRRDQIWFTEKDQKGATHLFPLSDVQTRRTDNIEKGYLQGRFGAIPFAGSVTALFGE